MADTGPQNVPFYGRKKKGDEIVPLRMTSPSIRLIKNHPESSSINYFSSSPSLGV
jgi:hypothetical protein